MLSCINDAERRGTVSGVTNSAGEHSTHVGNVARRGNAHGDANGLGVVATLVAAVGHVASKYCHTDAAAALIVIIIAAVGAANHNLGRTALEG